MPNQKLVRQTVEEQSSDISENAIIEAIRNQRRRYALYYLQTRDGPVNLDELVTRVAAWETCSPPDEVTCSQRRSVYTSLYQTHLPRLEQRGLVRFDKERNQVVDRLDSSGYELLLDAGPKTSVEWYRVYLVLALGGAVLFGLSRYDAFPLGTDPVVTGIGIAAVLLTTVSAVHWYDTHRWRRRRWNTPPDYYVSDEN